MIVFLCIVLLFSFSQGHCSVLELIFEFPFHVLFTSCLTRYFHKAYILCVVE